MGDNKTKLFACYSIPLRDFLKSNGIKYEIVGLNPNTHKMFWVFVRTNELNRKLDKWRLEFLK